MVNDIIIGKYTLESLTNGMYASSLDIFREYVQNSVDSIDEAISTDLINHQDANINIVVDKNRGFIGVYDNGVGLSNDVAVKTLLDIGNSSKNRNITRGFRGIGRLAGLGYCDELVFTTSVKGEQIKTIITFNTKLLKELLTDKDNNQSIIDVINAIAKVKRLPEKSSLHYFHVEMNNVSNSDTLLNEELVKKYLIQNLPLKFSDNFKWGEYINKKIKSLGYNIPSYNIKFSNGVEEESLYKPYYDSFISDRVKKYVKEIKDVDILPITDENCKLIGLLWYAVADYSGTIINDEIKGIRIRQGNILIGNKLTANQYFKEERFNGWLLGELYVIDSRIIPNARRDDFENNDIYIQLKNAVNNWSASIAKTIRKISYERNISQDSKKILENSDVNDLIIENIDVLGDQEGTRDNVDEMTLVAENELYDRFSILLEKKSCGSKYMALNLRKDIPYEQKKVLERVFDSIFNIYSKRKAEKIVDDIVLNYK